MLRRAAPAQELLQMAPVEAKGTRGAQRTSDAAKRSSSAHVSPAAKQCKPAPESSDGASAHSRVGGAGVGRALQLLPMREADFFRDDAKSRAAQAVKAVEAQTSAELVIAVRHRSGNYGVVAYHFGFGAMAAVTLILLVAPQVFSIGAIAIDGLAAFVLAALVCANVGALTRALTRATTRRLNVETAARAAFFDLGITRTSGRNGILVFISTFERTLAVLTDVGIDTKALGVGWTEARTAMDVAIRQKDFKSFVTAFERLGPVLGAAMPRAADDVNELPDEVQ